MRAGVASWWGPGAAQQGLGEPEGGQREGVEARAAGGLEETQPGAPQLTGGLPAPVGNAHLSRLHGAQMC